MELKITAYNDKKYYNKTVTLLVDTSSIDYKCTSIGLSIYSTVPNDELMLILDEFRYAINYTNLYERYCYIDFKKGTDITIRKERRIRE